MEENEIPKITEKKNEAIELLKNTSDKVADEKNISEKIKETMTTPAMKKMEELKEMENRIDAKLAEIKKWTLGRSQDLGGKSEAGYIAKAQDPEQVKKDRCNAWLKSTGFKIH